MPKNGHPSEVLARAAAHNIAVARAREKTARCRSPLMHAYCVMDTDYMSIMVLGDHMLGERRTKLAFEKYFSTAAATAACNK